MSMIKVINTISGQVALVPERYLKHPVLGKNLVPVEDDQKPYIAEMYEPKSADDFADAKPKRSKKTVEEVEPVDATVVDFTEIEEQ
jgi:hypothetical protein